MQARVNDTQKMCVYVGSLTSQLVRFDWGKRSVTKERHGTAHRCIISFSVCGDIISSELD